MFTHSINTSYGTDEGNAVTASRQYTGTTELGFDYSIPPATVNQEVDIAWIKSNVHALLIYSDHALTVKTNDATTPIDTLSLSAGQAIVWANDHVEPNPVGHDVTKLFLSNADPDTAAVVKIRVLVA
jgi:hypothetical protein